MRSSVSPEQHSTCDPLLIKPLAFLAIYGFGSAHRSGPAGEPGRSDSLVNGCMLDPEGTTEVTHVYHFNGTIHTGVPTEAEMIRHRREVHVAAKQLKEMIGPRRVLTVLRMIWDPEQGWTSRQDGGADCYIAGELSCSWEYDS